MKPVELTKSEKKFLKALAKLEKNEQKPTFRRIAKVAGWKSSQMSWAVYDKLKQKGVIEDARRYVVVKGPAITNLGLVSMRAA